MYPSMWSIEHSTSTGTEFESDFMGALHRGFKNHRVYKIENTAGSDMDKREGTDFICGGIRIDATLDFFDKDNMPFVADTGIPATRTDNFLIGVRHGNTYKGYRGFPVPVVVIGLDMTPREYYQHDEEIADNVSRHAEELITLASDCLDDYMTIDPKERQELFQPILRPNSRYSEPKGIEPQYSQINQARRLPTLPSTPSDDPSHTTDYLQ